MIQCYYPSFPSLHPVCSGLQQNCCELTVELSASFRNLTLPGEKSSVTVFCLQQITSYTISIYARSSCLQGHIILIMSDLRFEREVLSLSGAGKGMLGKTYFSCRKRMTNGAINCPHKVRQSSFLAHPDSLLLRKKTLQRSLLVMLLLQRDS